MSASRHPFFCAHHVIRACCEVCISNKALVILFVILSPLFSFFPLHLDLHATNQPPASPRHRRCSSPALDDPRNHQELHSCAARPATTSLRFTLFIHPHHPPHPFLPLCRSRSRTPDCTLLSFLPCTFRLIPLAYPPPSSPPTLLLLFSSNLHNHGRPLLQILQGTDKGP